MMKPKQYAESSESETQEDQNDVRFRSLVQIL